MRRQWQRLRAGRWSILFVVALVGAALPAGGAFANHTPNSYTNRTVTITPATSPQTWTGVAAVGANAFYDFDAGEPCFDPAEIPPDSDAENQFCDITLLHVDVAPSFWDTTFGGVRVSVAVNGQDYDLQVYESDAGATRGNFVGQSGNPAGLDETVFISKASGYYLIQVIYFVSAGIPFDGTAAFETFTRDPVPPDIDDPPGLQEFLASDPSAGFRSYSEPIIAQNPLNPDMLVAGSKFYNRDPDSLPEYEFKIGSFVSFDGGREWTQLGQIKACPLAEAPEETWPLDNTCYPEDVPGQEGPEEGGPDIGEEYITSDIWMHFDDEGNAYAMVLDAPPFASGNGWGMTLHKWESVSPEDVLSGDTWSDRIVINSYPGDDPIGRQELFLDDKNTFAVNNAGPDGDTQTGIMVACWGQNIQPAKQQIVCERSTDGGESWPDEPLPVSGIFPLVIGVHVVADPNDPDRFYAVWLQYATGLGGAATMEFTQSVDGGVTWLPSVTIATLDDVPRQFPNQQFRNLSIPIMAVSPSGQLYVVYAEYRPTADPADEDEMQADIMVIRNDLMGLPGFWTAPAKVNQDDTRADQFQPFVAVNPDGQVEVAYFDRRHDTEDNFYVDTFLSRSTDEGTSFTDHRLSHDMSSPEFNAPTSSSGLFFGDYQGLVVDQCFAYPFFQDTHLANDRFLDPGPIRDPEFDDGYPSSPFQEAFAWRVPNTPEFGGSGVDCEVLPEEPLRVSGGGQVPGDGGSGVASFGVNIRADADGASGSMNVKDHGTGEQIKLVSVDSVAVSGTHVTIMGTCRIGDGPTESCQIDAEDNAEPGKGADEFHLEVGGGTSYSGGGTLSRGNIQIHQ